jgi:nucleotide-binding universal stress UspA family protein
MGNFLFLVNPFGGMFKILLAVDSDEERALAGAEAISLLPDAAQTVQVTILNVEKKVNLADEGGMANSEEWYDKTDFPSSAEKARKHLEDTGISVKMRREHGDPAKVIQNISNEMDADRIVMSGRKRSPTGKVLFGSVTQSVLLNSEIPITVTMT